MNLQHNDQAYHDAHPHLLHQYLPLVHPFLFPPGLPTEELHPGTPEVDIASNATINSKEMGCPQRCYQNDFSLTKSNIGTNSKETENRNTLWAQFNHPYVTIEEEYILFDTVAIISATGGSLGLFLGLSCYSVIWTGFEWLETAFFQFKER